MLWPYVTPGIPDDLFERLPGIPMSKREVRLLLISHLRLQADSVVWDIGAGTGTIAVETGLLCPKGRIIAIERDEEVASLIRRNCDRFELNNVEVIEGSAPECLKNLSKPPHRVCIEGGRPIKKPLSKEVWRYLQPRGRVVATASQFRESLCAFRKLRRIASPQHRSSPVRRQPLGDSRPPVKPLLLSIPYLFSAAKS